MTDHLSFCADWVDSNGEGAPEEGACLAQLDISHGQVRLTEGYHIFDRHAPSSPILSAYHLAEWLAWNWWRLRWEPRSKKAAGWDFAHRMGSIGSGYAWPDITIFSDGHRTAIVAKPTPGDEATAFRYVTDYAAVIPSGRFELAVDTFVSGVLDRLGSKGVNGSNLATLWQDVTAERSDETMAVQRTFEALLGCNPDEADGGAIERLVRDSAEFSATAATELAADTPYSGTVLGGDEIRTIAETCGVSGSPRDAVRLSRGAELPRADEMPAWRLGAAAAQALRRQEGLGDGRVNTPRLAQLAGVSGAFREHPGAPLAFFLDTSPLATTVVLRSKWETGRRFELARLLADRLVPGSATLFPATRSRTYRQKMQRSFAAEFLCPLDALEECLGGDYSEESQHDAAELFQVSERTITTLLVNHGRIDRDEVMVEVDWAA